MKTILRVLSLAVVLGLAGVAAATAAVNLDGTWVLDRSQSQLPAHDGKSGSASGDNAQASAPPEVKLIVQQQGDTLKVTRTMSRNGKERSFTETLTTNGTERTENHRHGTTVSKATWSGDQLIVTETTTRTTSKGDVQMSRQSVWSISPDGRTLTVDTTFHGPRGDRTMKTVYGKS